MAWTIALAKALAELRRHAKTIDTHTDVEIVEPADGETLVYDAVNALWKNQPPPPAPPAPYARAVTLTVASSESKDTTNADYVCDGVDDQVEIMDAIDALPAKGGVVQLMDGGFYTSADIDILRSNVCLRGLGKFSVIKPVVAETIYAIHVGNGLTALDRIILQDLTVNGNKAVVAGGHGIFMHGGVGYPLTNCELINCRVHDAYHQGIRMTVCDNAKLSFVDVERSGTYNYGLDTVTNSTFMLCRGIKSGTYDIYFYDSTDNLIYGFISIDSGSYGIYFGGVRNSVFGMIAYNPTYAGCLVLANDNVLNSIVVLSAGSHGLYINAHHNLIANCIATASAGSGIYIYAGARNLVANCYTSLSARYGVEIATAYADENFIHGLYSRGDALGVIRDLGTLTRKEDIHPPP